MGGLQFACSRLSPGGDFFSATFFPSKYSFFLFFLNPFQVIFDLWSRDGSVYYENQSLEPGEGHILLYALSAGMNGWESYIHEKLAGWRRGEGKKLGEGPRKGLKKRQKFVFTPAKPVDFTLRIPDYFFNTPALVQKKSRRPFYPTLLHWRCLDK